MVVDFTPGMPGGQAYAVTLVWVLSGLVVLAFAVLLLWKYGIDFRLALQANVSAGRKSVAYRAVESTLLHGGIALLVTIVGVRSLIVTLAVDRDLPDLEADLILWGLVAIPWLLAIDMAREYRHQIALLEMGRDHRHQIAVLEGDDEPAAPPAAV